MAAALRAQLRSVGLASVPGVSKSRGGRVTIALRGTDSTDGDYFAVGKAADPPGTFSDWADDQGGAVPINRSVSSVAYNPIAGVYDVSLAFDLDAGLYTAGDTVYVGVFLGTGGVSPDGAAVPDLLAGPFPVVA